MRTGGRGRSAQGVFGELVSAGADGDLRGGAQRLRVAQEAARVMVEGGHEDYELAKRKAAGRLGVAGTRALPGNDEIEQALRSYQRLFRSHVQPRRLRELRLLARELMTELDAFAPKLAGSVLAGSADEHSDLTLHLFAESVEEVGMYLIERGVEYRPSERRIRFSQDEVERVGAYELDVEGVRVVLVVFAGRLRRRVPLCPVDGRPMARAGTAELARMDDEAELREARGSFPARNIV